MEKYEVSLHIQSEWGKTWTRITPDTDTLRSEQVTVKHLISWCADKKYIKYELKNCFAYEKPAINLQVCHEKDALKSAQFSI